jgi:myosin heavy subunit
MLGDFNEGPLLHTVRERYARQQIYTSIGSAILLSVNPYQRLNIFNTTTAQKYRKIVQSQRQGVNTGPVEPHLFLVAEDSFQDMLTDKKNQSIIITGESGAGKTEATKIILSYMSKASTGFVGPEEDLLYKKPSKES